MSRIEKGKMAPKISRLPEIAQILKCPVSSLFLTEADRRTERANEISEILSLVPEEAQVTLLELVRQSVKVMLMRID